MLPMPCGYEINPALRLVRSHLRGLVTYDEIMEHRRKLLADPAFRADYSQLTDLTEMTGTSVTSDEIQQLARGSPFVPAARRAAVAPADVAFGLTRMFASFRESNSPQEQFRVFRKLEDAMEWLALPGAGARSASE